MKSYDDLQRFKEKTHTNHIEFKDMSEQTMNSDGANWAIIKQLMTDSTTPTLGNGQSINVAVPQPVADNTFSLPETVPTPARSYPLTPPVSVTRTPRAAAFVAAQPAGGSSHSLLESISASLTSVPAARQTPADIVTQVHPSAPENPPVPAAEPASYRADAPRFKPLFNTPPEASQSLSKDTLLQPLLERIASCR